MKRFVILIFSLFAVQSISFADELDLHVSHGRSSDRIYLSWQSNSYREIVILRADKRKGPFREIARSSMTAYEDTQCVPGVEYFYKAVPVSQIRKAATISPVSGYRKIDLNERYSIEHEISKKKQNRNEFETQLDKSRKKLLKSSYMSWIELHFIFFVSQPYIDKGSLTVLTDFDVFYATEETNTITFQPYEENYQLSFVSSAPFQILRKSRDRELFDRLIRNGMAFCIYQGEIKIKDRLGRNKYIPKYEVIGLFTLYDKYSKDWASTTIMFSTEHEGLVKKVKTPGL